ncbi:hypothetical protein HK098_005143 [Nowakowskiella sp. JEL0407]|nr:hypothetical protein HK098_005143 [Nowakowskiella sp. JEL0407]
MNARNSTRSSLLPAHSPSLTVMPPSTSRKLSINNKVPFKPPKPISSAMKQDRPSLTVSSNPDMDRNFPPLIPKRRGRSRTTVASASNQPGNMVSINASLTIHDKSETGVEGTNEKNITENVVERMNFQIIESGIKPIEETIAGTVLKEDFSDKGQQRDEAKDRSLEDELFPQDSIEQTVEQSSTPKRRKIMDETQQPQPAMTPTEIAKIKEENGEQMSTPRKSRRRVTKWWTWVEKNVDEGNREADILVDTPMRSAARSALRKMHEIRREI